MNSKSLQDYLAKYSRLVKKQNSILYTACFLIITGIFACVFTLAGWYFPNILSWFWDGFSDMDNAGYWNGALLVMVGVSLACYGLFNMESLRIHYQNHWLGKLFENTPSVEYGKDEIGKFLVNLWESHIKPRPRHLAGFKSLKNKLDRQKQRIAQLNRDEVLEEWAKLNKQLHNGVKNKWEDSRLKEWWDKK